MKRLLTSAAMFLCCIATSFAQFSGSGLGTQSNPYKITNAIQLNQLRNYLNTQDVYFRLENDIDLTEFLENENPTQGWLPIGTQSTPFKGTLDGNGKTISGLWINRPTSDYVGFFASFYSGTVKNLTLKGGTIKGKDYVGLMSGADGDFIDCYFEGSISGASYVGGATGFRSNFTRVTSKVDVLGTGDYVGGLSAKNGKFTSCSVTCNYVQGNNYVGGMCGIIDDNGKYFSSCDVHTNIYGNDYVGGLCGRISNQYAANMSKCFFIGNISANSGVGGLCGVYNGQAECKDCYVLGHIEAQGNEVGGLTGVCLDHTSLGCNVTIDHCYFNGMVVGTKYVGGITGRQWNGKIKNCYAHASIVGTNSVGGICGLATGYSNAKSQLYGNVVIATSIMASDDKVGKIFGDKDNATIGDMGTSNENKAWNRTILIKAGVAQEVTDDLQNGTGVSNTTLKLKATYVAMGWDFNNTWEIQETECYPYMKWQTAPPVITSQLVSNVTVISGKCVNGGTVTLEVDDTKQQMVSTGYTFSFTVSPLQAGHDVCLSAKADGKEQSYFATETVSYLGKGTEADPYRVYTAADLTGVYRRGYFKLMNDIDLTDYINQFSPSEGWQSIGRDGSETVYFDGNGHKITGLWCNTGRNNTGLFSTFTNGEIKNLTVEVANGKQVKGGTNTGIIIGKMVNGTINNCKVSGSVADGTPVGGVVGLFSGGSITNCKASITISATKATSYIGGIVGEITSGTVNKCVTTGTLTATGTESYVGGLIGKNSATVTNCYSTATVTSSYNAAGLVAYNYGLVDKCYATGDLASNNFAAGVIGYNDGESAVISNCAAMNNKINLTYESQQVQLGGGYGMRIIGGYKNNAPTPEMNNVALETMQLSVNDIPQVVYDDIFNGVAKTNVELKQMATYQALGWDFTDIWKIDEGTSYPYQTAIVDGSSGNNDDPNVPDPVDPQASVVVTDISQMDNVIYIEPMEAKAGTQAVISFKMKNSVEIRSFQFDLYLPEGVTPVKSSQGRIQGSLSAGRLPEEDEHTLTFSEHEGGIVRFLCDSQYGDTFTGNDGEIATLQVNIAETMADGDYAIVMKDMKLSEVDIANYYQTAIISTRLTVSSYTLGDINDDGVVDVSDYSGVASHIHKNTPDGFNLKAADVDESGNIDVSDYSGIANIIHYGSIHGSAGSRQTRGPRRANTDLSQMDNVIYIKPFTAAAGTQASISICMKNTAEIRSFQFDLCLPEGMTAVKSDKGRIQGSLSAGRLPEEDVHKLTFSEHEGGVVRFLCDSEYGDSFTGNDGEIATLQVNIAESMTDGDYAIVMKDMKLSEVDIANYYVADDIETTVTIGETGTPILGDVNNDGSVTPADAIMILYAYFGVQQTNFNEAAADLNGDNDITPADAIEALYKYFGAGSSARANRPTAVMDSGDPE